MNPVAFTKFYMNNFKICLAVFVNVLLFSSVTKAAELPGETSQVLDSSKSVESGTPPAQINQLAQTSEPQARSLDPELQANRLHEAKLPPTDSLVSDLEQSYPVEEAHNQRRSRQIAPTNQPSNISQLPNAASLVEPAPSVDLISEEDTNGMDQVTNVSQLRDVAPSDWAYEALRSLVERYGCIAGYPDGTYRGNRAMSRYEFAAGLNACLNQVERLIASGTADFVRKQDLVTLQRLIDEFRTELTTLGGRVDKLEGRVAFLEDHQFSTTTKLNVEVITYLGDAFGENASDVNNTTFNYRARIDFNTSFTGQDRLRTRLQATNIRLFDTGATFGGTLGSDTAGQTGETRFVPSSVSQNGEVRINQLEYRFPVGDRLKVYLEAGPVDVSYVTDTITPFIDTANTGISNFGQANPVYFPIGNQAGIGFNLGLSKAISLDFGYFGEAAGATQAGRPNDPNEDSGIFEGGYQAFAQLVYKGDRLKVGLYYSNSYSQENGVDTLAGSNPAKVIDINTFSNPVVGNHYGIQANYRFSPRFELGGWVGYTAARAVGDVRGDADIWNYAVTLALPDLGKEGNLGGIVLGMQPRLTGTSNSALAAAIGLPDGQRKDRDVGFHVEAFYRYQLTENISITPGVFWLTAPNHDERNPDAVIGVIRTSFVF